MAITFMAQPLVVLADTYGEPENGYTQENEEYPQEQPEELDPLLAARLELFEMLYSAIPQVTRMVVLTDEAREIALYDFDHFAAYMLATVPTRHMFARLFGITMEDYLASIRHLIYNNVPVPSITAADIGSRWEAEPTDARMIAADYLYMILHMFVLETGGFGHFIPQGTFLVEHTLFSVAYSLYHAQDELDAETLELLEYYGIDVDWFMASGIEFAQAHYDILSRPEVLWFYEIDPSEFDFYVDLMEQVGTMNEDNITTYIIEEDRIAYIHIASFMNNLIMDSEVLFPFYAEIQDFEHLIIDIRGNGGGMVGHFPNLVVSMLIDEAIYFTFPEFFVANERTAQFFQNPVSMAGAVLDSIVPAAEAVQSQGLTQFNREDLAFLDYAVLWTVAHFPSDDAVPFGGQIWLLVDGGSASASVVAAQLAASTDFATVVGEPTSRVTGVVYTHVAMPNTGIVFRLDLGYTTGPTGHSVEEFGIVPEIANFDGMNALETVLAIITANDPAPVEDVTEEDATEESEVRYINGVAHVRLRYVAAALGAQVEWDGPNQSVIVTAADGSSFVVVVSSHGVINYNGRVYVPVVNLEAVLADLLV